MKTTTGKKTATKKGTTAKKTAQKTGVPMTEIRAVAKALDIASFGKSKQELIRAIQRAEHNFDCYATAVAGYCDQTGCCWRADCMEESAKL